MFERSLAWCLQDNHNTNKKLNRDLHDLGKTLKHKLMQWCETEAFCEKADKYLDILYEEFDREGNVDATWVHNIFEGMIFGPHLEGLSLSQQHQGKLILLDLRDITLQWNALDEKL